MELSVTVPFGTEAEATIAYNSLRVDPEPSRSRVTKVLRVEGPRLVASFKAEQPRNLRVSVHSFLEHLALVTATIDQFGPAVGSSFVKA